MHRSVGLGPRLSVDEVFDVLVLRWEQWEAKTKGDGVDQIALT